MLLNPLADKINREVQQNLQMYALQYGKKATPVTHEELLDFARWFTERLAEAIGDTVKPR